MTKIKTKIHKVTASKVEDLFNTVRPFIVKSIKQKKPEDHITITLTVNVETYPISPPVSKKDNTLDGNPTGGW